MILKTGHFCLLNMIKLNLVLFISSKSCRRIHPTPHMNLRFCQIKIQQKKVILRNVCHRCNVGIQGMLGTSQLLSFSLPVFLLHSIWETLLHVSVSDSWSCRALTSCYLRQGLPSDCRKLGTETSQIFLKRRKIPQMNNPIQLLNEGWTLFISTQFKMATTATWHRHKLPSAQPDTKKYLGVVVAESHTLHILHSEDGVLTFGF